MNKRKFPVTNIGSVSLLMIFIVLCMVTLAALSLSTASGSYRSAQTLAGHTTAYYRASNKAEKKLAKTEKILQACYHSTSDADSYYQQVRQQLGITGSDGSLIYSFRQLSASHRNWKSGSRSPIRTVPLQPGLTGKIQILLLHSIRSPVGK